MANIDQFISLLLQKLGAPETAQNRSFLKGWQRWEGGWTNNDASFNPWNTTSGGPGALGSINSVGVKKYDTLEHGLDATVRTLNNGRYGDILTALKSGDPFKAKPVAGLSTWLSGKPDSASGAAYASKVLGTRVSPGAASPAPQAASGGATGAPAPQGGGMDQMRQMLLTAMLASPSPSPSRTGSKLGASSPLDGVLSALVQRQLMQQQGGTTSAAASTQGQAAAPTRFVKGELIPGPTWKGTHITDGLDWNHGQRTAEDIMAKAGTPVGSPEAGVITRWGSAQGGEAMYLKGQSGTLYWLGHIDNRLPVGTRVKRGEVIARISADHPRPHLHIDRKL